jgi:hypothetical protein
MLRIARIPLQPAVILQRSHDRAPRPRGLNDRPCSLGRPDGGAESGALYPDSFVGLAKRKDDMHRAGSVGG